MNSKTEIEVPFSDLRLQESLLKNLSSMGYRATTPIQAQSLPHILENEDVIAQAKTGSGKTVAFGLGLLQKLKVKQFRVQSLVLCPTRELADQVAKEIRKLARTIHNIKVLTLCGGMPFGPQIGSLEHGAHIVVGTPGRIEEHLRKGTLVLDSLTTLVLDEADRMLDMGFQATLDAIIEHTPKQRQTLLFSATFPDQIQSISRRIMSSPVTVKITEAHDSSSIKQSLFKVDDNDSRIEALYLLLLKHRPDSTLVFCNTKIETQEVADKLCEFGFNAQAIHGDLEQRDRDQTLVRFSNKSISIMVATDVAARGLDIEELGAVINYHLARDPEVHVHRIGRTGRAGKKGIACSLFTNKESYKIERLEAYLKQHIPAQALPPRELLKTPPFKSSMATLQIDGGKRQKVRAGDILGALTGKDGIEGKQVGKINIFDQCAYVAVQRDVASEALKKISQGTLKGRSFRIRRIRG